MAVPTGSDELGGGVDVGLGGGGGEPLGLGGGGPHAPEGGQGEAGGETGQGGHPELVMGSLLRSFIKLVSLVV